MTEPRASHSYDGPAGVMFTPTELQRIYAAFVGRTDPKDVLIRGKVSRFLNQLAEAERSEPGG